MANILEGLGISNLFSWATPENQTPSTTEVAFAALKTAADNGDLIAILKVAAMFESGDGVEQSLEKALEYEQKALLQTQEKVNALAMKLNEQRTAAQKPIVSMASAGTSPASAVASSATTSPAIVTVSIINSSAIYKKADSQFLIAQQLKALGITLDSEFVKLEEQPGNTPSLELMIIDLSFRSYEVICSYSSQIRRRLRSMSISPIPLILILASNEESELRVAFFKGELQALVKERQRMGELCDEDGKPLNFSIAPLYINTDNPRSVKPFSEQFIKSHIEEYANVGTDPKKLRDFIVSVLTDGLYDVQK